MPHVAAAARLAAAPRMSTATALSVERALQAARACSLAFVPPGGLAREPYAEGLELVAQVEDPASQAGATVFRSSSGELIVACRGSSSARNFRTNLDVGPVPLTIGGAHPTARVHAGFQKAAAALWERIEPHAGTHAGPVLVTGHSLGGGTATLLALHLAAAGRRDLELITVAGPRLGDGAFARHFRDAVPAAASHLVHDDDAVLSSNTQLWDDLGFEHVGAVVRCAMDEPCVYDGGAECLAERAPPPAGPPSLKGVFVDHCRYLGLYIGLRLEHPRVWLRPPWEL